jgi:hypothetical protein
MLAAIFDLKSLYFTQFPEYVYLQEHLELEHLLAEFKANLRPITG